MKEFKKWLIKDSKETGYLYDAEAERQRKKAWRAAVEWMKKLMELEEDDMVLTRASLLSLIEKELEEE